MTAKEPTHFCERGLATFIDPRKSRVAIRLRIAGPWNGKAPLRWEDEKGQLPLPSEATGPGKSLNSEDVVCSLGKAGLRSCQSK